MSDFEIALLKQVAELNKILSSTDWEINEIKRILREIAVKMH